MEERDFFISYTRADEYWARWIAVELERAGYTVVFQTFDFRPGSDFVHEMHEATVNAKRTVAVLSPDYFGSKFSEAEWRVAFAKDPSGEKGFLLPFRIRECIPTGLLATRVYVDLVGLDEDSAREALLAAAKSGVRPTHASFPGKSRSAWFPGGASGDAISHLDDATRPKFEHASRQPMGTARHLRLWRALAVKRRQIALASVVSMAVLTVLVVISNGGQADHNSSVIITTEPKVPSKIQNAVPRPPSVMGTITLHGAPGGLRMAPDGKHIYTIVDDKLTIIDTSQPNVEPTVVTLGPGFGYLVLSRDGKRAYATNSGSNSFIAIDTAQPQAAPVSLKLPLNPMNLALSSDGTRAYVSNYGDDSISIIDTIRLAAKPVTIKLAEGQGDDGRDGPLDLAPSPDGKRLYVTNSISDSLSIVDITQPSIAPKRLVLPTGDNPSSVRVSSDGSLIYFVNFTPGTMSIVESARPTVEPITVRVGNGPEGIVFSPDGNRAYVVNRNSDTISIVDTKRPTAAVTSFGVGHEPGAMALSPDGSRAYVMNAASGSVSIIDTTQPANPPATVIVGENPASVAVSPDGSRAYVANDTSRTISIIDTGLT